MKEQAIVVPRSRTFQLASSKAIDPAGGKSNKPLGAIAKPLRGSQASLAATTTNSHNPKTATVSITSSPNLEFITNQM